MAHAYIEFKIDKIRKFRLDLKAQKRIEKLLEVRNYFKINIEEMTSDEIATLLWATMEDKEREAVDINKFMDILSDNLTIRQMHDLRRQLEEDAFGKNEIAPTTEATL